MTNDRFASMREAVLKAKPTDDIWYQGYLFLGLTERQCSIIAEICKAKGFEEKEGYVQLPNGIGIR